MTNMSLLKEIYPFIDPNIKYDFDILKLMAEKNKNIPSHMPKVVEVFKDLPDQYKNNVQWCMQVLLDYPHLVEWTNLKNNYNNQSAKNIFRSWINNKDHVIHVCKNNNSNNNPNFYLLYELLNEELKNDHDVIKVFVENYPLMYKAIPKNLQPDYIKKFLMAYEIPGKFDYHKINHSVLPEEICKLNDREVFMHLAKKKEIAWFLDSALDKKWLYDIQLMKNVLLAHDYAYRLPGISNVLNRLPKDDIIELVTQSKVAYGKLPSHLRNSPEIAIVCLKTYNDLPIVSKILFWDKDFCVDSLQYQPSLINKIPDIYWKEKDFILKFCNALDDNRIKKDILKQTPPYIKKFFDAFNIEGGYTNFMEKYFLKLNLNKNLPINETTVKRKKI